MVVGGIVYDRLRTIGEMCLREIAHPLSGRGDRNVLLGGEYELACDVRRNEEKQLVLQGMKFGDNYRAAKRSAESIEAITRPLQAVEIVGERIGVQIFMAMEQIPIYSNLKISFAPEKSAAF